jgi:DNA-binding response OmpR family regulator
MSSPSRASGEAGSSTVMVVEPDILVRMIIAEYLRECGYKVIEGVAAADVFIVLEAGDTIDVVLSEVRLPGNVDGFSMARRLRQSYPKVDVVLTSGVANSADKAGGLCAEGPLEKPYHPQDVLRQIEALRERRRTSRSRG